MIDIPGPKKGAIASTKPKLNSLSAREILDRYVGIAEQAEILFDSEMLYDRKFHAIIPFQEGSYKWLIRKAAENAGMGTEFIPGKYEPPFGHPFVPCIYWNHLPENQRAKGIKSALEKVIGSLNLLEKGLFERTNEEDLEGVEYHIMFPWSSSDRYFVEDWLPGWFEEMGVPGFLVPAFSYVYAKKEKLIGKKDEKKVAQDMQGILRKLNAEDTAILNPYGEPGDLFSYRERIFHLNKILPGQCNLFSTLNNTNSPDLIWAYALFNRKEFQPIGYTILRVNDSQMLGAGNPLRVLSSKD